MTRASPKCVQKILQDRALMLSKARSFFSERNVLEVDCPILSKTASVDAHIDLIYSESSDVYLHSSPEYGMKKLLAKGSGDIYQLSHVFRKGELGSKHRPEFMMAEWYRVGFSYEQMIEEACAFITLFLGPLPIRHLSYDEAFKKYAGIDLKTATCDDLSKSIDGHSSLCTRDDWLNLILPLKVEPYLGREELTVITHYPASQCALAKTALIDGALKAKRFEIYHEGLELANGYDELNQSDEQRNRLQIANAERKAMGKEELPIDDEFCACLDALPDCCGVAVGFDRLMMLRHHAQDIGEVIHEAACSN